MKLIFICLGLLIINLACNQRVLDKKIIDDSIQAPTDFLRTAYSIEEALKNRHSIGELSLSNVVDLDSIYLLENLYSLTIKNYSREITALRIPERLFTLKQLTYLYIDGCKVILPQSISPDSRLETLRCWLSDTTSLSTNLENFSHLKHLLIKYKGTAPLPFRLEHLTQLESLELTLDRLTDLPASIGMLTDLESLKVMFYGNEGIGLPQSFTKLTKLKRLDLPVVEHLPENFHQLDQLNYLELELKEKSKEVVLTSVATLPVLTTLKIRWIDTRDFHFPIDLNRLKVLDLSHLYLNSFSCAMTHLKQLHLKNKVLRQKL